MPPAQPLDLDYRPSYLAAAITSLAVFVLYVVTLAPTTAMWDTSEYIASAFVLGNPHPPGNPLFVLLGRVFAVMPLPFSVAVKVNLLAAVTSALSAGFWFLITERVLVGWLSAGSVPGVLVGTWVFSRVLTTDEASATIRTWIGAVLIVALGAMIAKNLVAARVRAQRGVQPLVGTEMPVKVLPTLLLGLVVGVIVGMTSVGSGSLIVTVLLLLYPLLRPSVLVGTDITQAVPMLIAGAIAHAGLGDIDLAVVASLLIGQIPGVLVGTRLSSRYDGHLLRWLLMVVLAATALKLLGAPSLLSGIIAVAGVVVIGALIVRDRRRSARELGSGAAAG